MTSPNPNSSRVLVAPVSGLVVPVEKVPDPTFAQKMVGDGVAI
ncbi:MAG: PTS glucose transporter subunit IIA, partial [Deltaproteobacteria bacterium]|nr:PTS glucose transporter subunit IIA [Deltaproteobacteria bacterium]